VGRQGKVRPSNTWGGQRGEGPGRCAAQLSATGLAERETRVSSSANPTEPAARLPANSPRAPRPDRIPRQPRLCISHHHARPHPLARAAITTRTSQVLFLLAHGVAHGTCADARRTRCLPAHARACDSCPPAPPLGAGSDACTVQSAECRLSECLAS
jgi:hypothetical protein